MIRICTLADPDQRASLATVILPLVLCASALFTVRVPKRSIYGWPLASSKIINLMTRLGRCPVLEAAKRSVGGLIISVQTRLHAGDTTIALTGFAHIVLL
jgi:hypothetical protein